MDQISQLISKELNLSINHVKNVISLIDDGNTIPFIARYRKEMTGSMDDQVIRNLSERLLYLRKLENRKQEVLKSIKEQEQMTEELDSLIAQAMTLAEVEDIYRPFKPKRKTRALIAKEKGLDPLAKRLLLQDASVDPESIAIEYINIEKNIETVEDAISGARDIIAEIISDDAEVRKMLKDFLRKKGVLSSKATNADEDSVYRMYYDFSEGIVKIQSHRVLAINRGEREGFLKVSLEEDKVLAIKEITEKYIINDSSSAEQVSLALEDSYNRLIKNSIENEIRNELSEIASTKAIKTFALNLRPLLMQPPIKNKVTMGFDPAYRTGCKIAVVDGNGKVLDTAVVYPTPPNNEIEKATEILKKMIEEYSVEVISIGNGTASKESEIFVANLIKGQGIEYMVVSEAGASVYSASKLAANEFPDYDVSIRSAISIARRLQDPLAELVKIDPKSIGVGQYQHDMAPAMLDESLTGVVEDCVNSVGVNLNTASPQLLACISGINSGISKNIVTYREENGSFTSRKQLLNVPKLGPKAYEQCAGFLRVSDGENILDNTAVHPEAYDAAIKLLGFCGYTLPDVKNRKMEKIDEKVNSQPEKNVADYCGIGIPTLRDIISELQKPGRDPRDELPPPMLRSDVMSLDDLKPGMELKGTVRNVVDFGVFVDIGVHQDGLVHISKLANKFVKHPSDVVKTGDIVNVTVKEVDIEKKRISLSMI